MKKIEIIIGIFCVCLGKAFSMAVDVMSPIDKRGMFSDKLISDFNWKIMMKSYQQYNSNKQTNKTSDENFLEECNTAVQSKNYKEAVRLFKKALNSNEDPACFFFGDIVRLLISKSKVKFKMSELYTDCGITDDGIIKSERQRS